MRRSALVSLMVVAAAAAAETRLPATRDALLYLYPPESTWNGGHATRLRARELGNDAASAFCIDVDHAALASFVDAHRGATAQLRLWVRGVGNGASGKLEAAALDTPTDWNEGAGDHEPAKPGEVTSLAAQCEAAPWMTVDGKTMRDVRGLFYDRTANRVTSLAARQALTLTPADVEREILWPLDAALVEHLAHERFCRGLVIFTRDPSVLLDVYSREQTGREPTLVLTSP